MCEYISNKYVKGDNDNNKYIRRLKIKFEYSNTYVHSHFAQDKAEYLQIDTIQSEDLNDNDGTLSMCQLNITANELSGYNVLQLKK